MNTNASTQRVLPPTPTLSTWWTQPITQEQFYARAKQEAERMNAVTQNYAQPVKMGDE